jgi:hypothetical protein
MELWELMAREAIRETVARYAHYADSGRFADLAELFADEGTLDVETEQPLHGRTAIRDFLTRVALDLATESTSKMIRHNVSNLTIDFSSEREATGRCYFLAVTDIGVDHWGRYRDVYCPESDGTWKFAYRNVRTDGRVPGGFAARRVD